MQGIDTRALCVLDIETAPDPTAHRIARRTKGDSSANMHEIRSFAILRAGEREDGSWTGFDLVSHHGADEFRTLMELEEQLVRADHDRATIVTYNGTKHDLPMITRRAAANWMFSLRGLASVRHLPHLDLFRANSATSRGDWPSLVELGANFRIPMDHTVVLEDDDEHQHPRVRKPETDVAGTFVTLLFELAILREDEDVLVKGWGAFVDHIRDAHPNVPHLEQFCHNRALQTRRNAVKSS